MQKASLGIHQTATSAVAPSLSREQKMSIMRVQIALSSMEEAFQKAESESDVDNKIAFLERARDLCGTASDALASLRTMDIDTTELMLTFGAANKTKFSLTMSDTQVHLNQVDARISVSLANAFHSKIETANEANDVDEKIRYLELEREENNRGEGIYAKFHDFLLPMPREDQKKLLVASCINLANAYRSKASSIVNDEKPNVMKLLMSAQESIGAALKTLGELPDPRKLKEVKNNATWIEWEIKYDLVTAHDEQITKLNQHAGDALRKLDSRKSDAPKIRAEFLTDFEEKVEILLEGSEKAVSRFRDMQNVSKKLRKMTSVWDSATDDNRNGCIGIIGEIRTTLVEVAVMNAHYKTELASARLEQVKEDAPSNKEDSSSNLHNLEKIWQRQHKETIRSLRTLFNLGDEKKPPALSGLEKCKVLASLVNQLKEKESHAQWLTTQFKRQEMPQHAEQFAMLEACCEELGITVEDELKNSKAELSKEEKSALHQEEQQECDVWVRGKKDEAVNEAAAESEDEEKSSVEEQQQRGPQTTTKGLEAAKGKLAKLQEEVESSTNLSEFILNEQGPFSQFDAVFIKTVENQKRAVDVLSDIVVRLAKLQSPSEHLMKEAEELKTELQSRKTWLANSQNERIHAAKTLPPSGRALEFLLVAGQIARVEQTEDRKKLKGQTIASQGVMPADYMDEHQIFIKGLAQPLILHTHYRTEDAPLEEKTASHLKFKDAAAEDVRNRVSLEILEKLHSRFPVNNG
jgi:hypothetical protein